MDQWPTTVLFCGISRYPTEAAGSQRRRARRLSSLVNDRSKARSPGMGAREGLGNRARIRRPSALGLRHQPADFPLLQRNQLRAFKATVVRPAPQSSQSLDQVNTLICQQPFKSGVCSKNFSPLRICAEIKHMLNNARLYQKTDRKNTISPAAGNFFRYSALGKSIRGVFASVGSRATTPRHRGIKKLRNRLDCAAFPAASAPLEDNTNPAHRWRRPKIAASPVRFLEVSRSRSYVYANHLLA